MVLRRPNSKDIVLHRNSDVRGSSILEKFRGNLFSRITNFKNFAGIDFRESKISGVRKGILFREFGQNSQNFLSVKFLPLRYVVEILGLMVTFIKTLITRKITSIGRPWTKF